MSPYTLNLRDWFKKEGENALSIRKEVLVASEKALESSRGGNPKEWGGQKKKLGV